MSGQVLVMEETWSDYDGDQIYADFTVDSGTVTVTAEYQPGIAKNWVPLDPEGVLYYHADHLGTTRLTTNHLAVVFTESAYTAFGERHSGMNDRYGYAGAWGYQSHSMDEVDPPLDPATIFPYLHVGARYYDPATGRFLQRDPIGIDGGSNVYEYAGSRPTATVDADGLYPFGGFARDFHPNWPKLSSPSEIIKSQLIGAAVGAAACAGAAVAYYGGGHALRWLNRGKFRIGPSRHKGVWRLSVRWKTDHWDIPFLRW